MTTIDFNEGDRFFYLVGQKREFGIVLSDGKALLFHSDEEGRGRSVEKKKIPNNILPIERKKDPIPRDINFAMAAVELAISICNYGRTNFL